jgi:hypothetical protein
MNTTQTVELNSMTGWEQVLLPHTNRPISIRRLRISPRQGLTAMVEYPPGWEFTTTGSYAADLEFVVLDGSLTINGTTLRSGEYVYLESGYFWSSAKTVTGAVVFQRFAETPRWIESDRPRTRIGQKTLYLPAVSFSNPTEHRVLRQGRGTATRLVARLLRQNVAAADAELLDLQERRWFYLPPGAPLPELDRVLTISPAP